MYLKRENEYHDKLSWTVLDVVKQSTIDTFDIHYKYHFYLIVRFPAVLVLALCYRG